MRQISKIINVKLYVLIIFLSLFYGLAFTFSDFYNSPFDNAKDFFILSLQWGVVVTATFGFLYLIIINKYIFAIVFPLLTICCGILTYMRYALQISLTPMLLDLAFVNDAGTWLENFNLLILILIIASLLFSAVPCGNSYFYYTRYQSRHSEKASLPTYSLRYLLQLERVYQQQKYCTGYPQHLRRKRCFHPNRLPHRRTCTGRILTGRSFATERLSQKYNPLVGQRFKCHLFSQHLYQSLLHPHKYPSLAHTSR